MIISRIIDVLLVVAGAYLIGNHFHSVELIVGIGVLALGLMGTK